MTVTFRPATREDVARAEAAIESFVASFDGKSLVSDALGSLVAGLRDSLLDRDLFGPDLQQTLRAAMFGTPDRSLPSLRILHDRLSERFGRPDPRQEF